MKYFAIVLLVLAVAAGALTAAEKKVRTAQKAAPAALSSLAPEGKRNFLPGGGWFVWKFSEKPKMGTVIVKVQVFGKEGGQEAIYEITGESGMPSMRYHDSGPVKFRLNRKGDYLLPVDVVMPGEWRLVIRVKHGPKEIYAGEVVFNI